MEENKTIIVAQKVKAVAITFIGAGIFSQGTLYFKEQLSYNIPRILYPVYKLLGNKGLAVAMIILGASLIYYGYTKWKNVAGKPGTFGAIAIAAVALFFSVLFFTGKKKTSPEDLMAQSDRSREKAIEKIKSMDKPVFEDKTVNNHFAIFEIYFKQYKSAVEANDEPRIKELQTQYISWSERAAELMGKLETIEQKQQMVLYISKLALQWEAVK